MIPIYEQGHGRGIGHNLSSFLERLEDVCQEHEKNKQAKSFAFIFYDFENVGIRTILKNTGVFAKLDRLSGEKLSIFYLHAPSKEGTRLFNQTFISKLGLGEDVEMPCVVFFKLGQNGFSDIAVVTLDSTDLIHSFSELYDVIEHYIAGDKDPIGPRLLRWAKSASKFVSIEVVRNAIRSGLSHIPF